MDNTTIIKNFVDKHSKFLTQSEQLELKDLLYELPNCRGIVRFLELYAIARMGDVTKQTSDYELGSRDVIFELRKLLSIIK